MSFIVDTSGARKKINRQSKRVVSKVRSRAASAINKEVRTARRKVVESLMAKTGLKRKTLNDRLAITRANPKSERLEARITPIFGRKLYMMDYPWAKALSRGRDVIRLLSPIYRKNMRTGFISRDKTRMYLRLQGSAGHGRTASYTRAVKGRSVPRLFTEFKMKERYESLFKSRVMNAIRSVFGK